GAGGGYPQSRGGSATRESPSSRGGFRLLGLSGTVRNHSRGFPRGTPWRVADQLRRRTGRSGGKFPRRFGGSRRPTRDGVWGRFVVPRVGGLDTGERVPGRRRRQEPLVFHRPVGRRNRVPSRPRIGGSGRGVQRRGRTSGTPTGVCGPRRDRARGATPAVDRARGGAARARRGGGTASRRRPAHVERQAEGTRLEAPGRSLSREGSEPASRNVSSKWLERLGPALLRRVFVHLPVRYHPNALQDRGRVFLRGRALVLGQLAGAEADPSYGAQSEHAGEEGSRVPEVRIGGKLQSEPVTAQENSGDEEADRRDPEKQQETTAALGNQGNLDERAENGVESCIAPQQKEGEPSDPQRDEQDGDSQEVREVRHGPIRAAGPLSKAGVNETRGTFAQLARKASAGGRVGERDGAPGSKTAEWRV